MNFFTSQSSLNHALAHKLEAHFKPLGIAAFSRCCRFRCTATYADDPVFEDLSRDQGIYFIRFHLDGMNYNERPKGASAYYCDFDYLMREWESEKALLVQWCSILGLKPGDYTIEKPRNENIRVLIDFAAPYILEESSDNDCLSYMDMEA